MFFQKAKPIFDKEARQEANRLVVFEATADLTGNEALYITAAPSYQVSINHQFLAAGPARTAAHYARVDILSLAAFTGKVQIRVLVATGAPHTLSVVTAPPFFIAEVRRGEEVLAYTGRDFDIFPSEQRVQKVGRYSSQRQCIEVWNLREPLIDPANKTEPFLVDDSIQYLDRRAPYPVYEDTFYHHVHTGHFTENFNLPFHTNFYSDHRPIISPFKPEEVAYTPYEWLQRQERVLTEKNIALPLHMEKGDYALIDLKRIEVGFIQVKAMAKADSDFIIGFSEDGTPEEFFFTDIHAHTALEMQADEGRAIDFLSYEPYSVRYAIFAIKEGAIDLQTFGIKSYRHDCSQVVFPDLADPVLASIYRAAVRTFAHNAVDLFTDCPSRERAGWLCDSYFTAKAEYALFGETKVEDAFLENYRLFQNDGTYPEGMIPMCYPSDPVPDNHKFIPQWSMWYILEVADYVLNRHRESEKEKFRDSVYGLLSFYQRYENSDGLLESLPSWNFVEWSKANEWTQDVNYPTNFLYAGVLDAVDRLYGDENCRKKAAAVRKTTLEQSFDGRLFLDHAVRKDGRLVRLNDCSEAAQYYAILFGQINLSEPRYREMMRLILHVFGATRSEAHPEIAEINAFIGAYLRMEVLLKLKEYDLVLRDIKEFFGAMCEETGTLWEYRERHGSRDHGFASYAAVVILQRES